MLELMYITNKPAIALACDRAGIDRVWIDLEINGKKERQANIDSVKSLHRVEDIGVVKEVLKNAKLQVRINPIHENSCREIDDVINAGADIIMLPYYKSLEDVQRFISLVNGRATTVLLIETREAVACLDQTLQISGINEFHVGLNDLHLSYGLSFMFELLVNGILESICKKLKTVDKPYGFGGIARLGGGMLPAERIIVEHYRLGSSRAILSRSFYNETACNRNDADPEVCKFFKTEVDKIREFERSISTKPENFFQENKKCIEAAIAAIITETKNKE